MDFESKITFEIPSINLDFHTLSLSNNFTVLLTEIERNSVNSELINNNNHHKMNYDGLSAVAGVSGGNSVDGGEYDRFIGDVWVGIILTLMIASSVFCMCACFLYHKYRQWKTNSEYFFIFLSL